MEQRAGGCHCKALRYEAMVDLTQPVIECNCSHCQIKGLLLTFVPSDTLTIRSGEENLTEYRFNTETLQHLFCKTCGVEAFARGEKDGAVMFGLNVRTLENIDLSPLTRMPFDGKSK